MRTSRKTQLMRIQFAEMILAADREKAIIEAAILLGRQHDFRRWVTKQKEETTSLIDGLGARYVPLEITGEILGEEARVAFVLLGLITLCAVLERNGSFENGQMVLEPCTVARIDQYTRIPGLGRVMMAVGLTRYTAERKGIQFVGIEAFTGLARDVQERRRWLEKATKKARRGRLERERVNVRNRRAANEPQHG